MRHYEYISWDKNSNSSALAVMILSAYCYDSSITKPNASDNQASHDAYNVYFI